MKCSSAAATIAAVTLSAIALALQISHCGAFSSPRSCSAYRCTPNPNNLMKMSAGSWLYDIPNSSWTSPQWNWGYASGTGHDCAAICRRKFASRAAREDLVESLLHPNDKQPQPSSFEEAKLVLGLAIQRGRWDGSDGGPGGYGDVLAAMADARRYETDGIEESRMINFTNDMKLRYRLLNPTKEDMETMESIDVSSGDLTVDELDVARRKCSGLVLKSMGFIDNGL